MSEFETQNMEAIGLVKDGQQLPRVVVRVISEVDYHRYKRLERDALEAAEMAERNAWKEKVWRIAAAVGRAGCGAVFIGAAAEGLMDAVFAGVMTGVCVVWSLAGFFWGKSHG